MSELKMPLRKLLSSRTKSLREKRGLKQRHMAEALRITDRAYNGIEREKWPICAYADVPSGNDDRRGTGKSN